jgi:hypothetical protein
VLPDRLLPHSVAVLTPGSKTDRYGNTLPDWDTATSVTIRGRFELLPSDAVSLREKTVGRDDAVSVWRFFTNSPINMRQRLVWDSRTFDVDGEVGKVYDASNVHHYEAMTRTSDG